MIIKRLPENFVSSTVKNSIWDFSKDGHKNYPQGLSQNCFEKVLSPPSILSSDSCIDFSRTSSRILVYIIFKNSTNFRETFN